MFVDFYSLLTSFLVFCLTIDYYKNTCKKIFVFEVIIALRGNKCNGKDDGCMIGLSDFFFFLEEIIGVGGQPLRA